MIVFESLAKILQFLHLLAAITSIAACVHLIVRLLRSRLDRRIHVHARTLLVAYLSLYSLGSLVYPTFRVHVRAEFLDRMYPWASGLFEVKEHAATLALLPVIGVYLLTRPHSGDADRPRFTTKHAPLVVSLSSLILLVLVFNACVGWYLGSLKGL
jgi:hypothetical protein